MAEPGTANPEPPEHVCWICGSTDAAPWKERSLDRPLQPDDLRITDSRYGVTLALRRCPTCGFIFAEGDDVAELTELYEQLDDVEYEQTQDTRRLQMQWILESCRRRCPEARTLLDIGAGAGLLVAEARGLGLEAEGVEPSRALVAAARQVNDVHLRQGVYPHPELAGRTFDLVCLVDVIEHVADPIDLLRSCAEAVNPGGLVVLITPDVGSPLARLLGQRWWHFRLAHVGYFDRPSLERAMRSAGLVTRSWVRAKWFFRVNYLAERVARFLPVGWFNRLSGRVPPLAWLYRRVIPLNLHDSWVVFSAIGAPHAPAQHAR